MEDRGAWYAAVHRAAMNWTWLSDLNINKHQTWKTLKSFTNFYSPLHESHSMVNKARKIKEGHTNWKRGKFSHSVVVYSGNSIAQAENKNQDKWKQTKLQSQQIN